MKHLSFSLLVALLLFWAQKTNAQSPQKYNYQAIARTAAGNLLTNTQVGLRITLHQASPTGATVYQETHLPTTNQFGLFSIEIGTGAVVSGLFSTIAWGSNAYYQQVELDPNGTTGGLSYTNMGTTQLISVPYALYAKEAGSVAGGGGTAGWSETGNTLYNNNTGTVSIGTAAPAQQSSLYVTSATDGIWADAEGGYTAITGSGTNGSTGINGSSDSGNGVSASSGTGSGLNAFSTSGYGINALTNAGAALHSNNFSSGNEAWLSTNDVAIYAKGRLDLTNIDLSTTSHFYYGPSQHIYLRSGTPGSFITLNDSHNGNIYLADGGGRVSINNGNASETGVLTVRGNGSANATAEFFPLAGDYNAAFNVPSSFNYRFNDGTGRYYSTFIRGGQTGSRVYLNDVHSGDVIAATGGGSVGIGTTEPNTRLHVVGQSTLEYNNSNGTYADAILSIATPVGGFAPSIAFVPQNTPNNGLVLQGYSQTAFLRNHNNTGYTSLFCLDVMQLSDARSKKEIEPIAQNQYGQYLQELRKVETISYLFEHETLNPQNPDFLNRQRGHKRIGFTAQSLPNSVQQRTAQNPQKPEGDADILFSTSGMLGLLTVGIKALDQEQIQLKSLIEQQQTLIEQQKADIEQLKKELEAIKKALGKQ